MNPKCVAQVTTAAGKALSPAKIQAIEDAISAQMRQLARQDRQRWQGLTRDQRIAEATAAAMEDVQKAAALKEFRATLQVLRTAEVDAAIGGYMKLNDLTRSQGLIRHIEESERVSHAVRNEAIGNLGAMIDAAESKDGLPFGKKMKMFLFDMDNPAMTADIVREVFGNADGKTGNKLAQAGAKAWLETIEQMRVRFNAAGGDIGKLGYGYLSQAHDVIRVFEAGASEWATKVLPLLDREQYVKPDGSLMNDAEVLDMLKAAHETIVTGGSNKTEPGQFKGSGARANRGSDHRVIHFRDGDAWMAYMRDFGEGSLYDSMLGHVSKMARDIALVERYGPNPEQQFRVQNDIAGRADVANTGADLLENRAFGNAPQAYWDIFSGKTGSPQNRVVARVASDVRNVQTAAKLGGAVITSLTDAATVMSTLSFNKLSYFEYLRNLGKQFDSENREFLLSHGIVAESLASSLNRWTADNLTHSLSGRVANSVMKLSLMNLWTDATRNAFAQTMMGGMARMAQKDWGSLSAWDRYLLERKGITESDWAIVQKAQPEVRDGYAMLTSDAIRATGGEDAARIANKVLGMVIDESQFAVIHPDMATRAIASAGGMPAGALSGELARAFAQFKSFPIAMLSRHWRRVLETPQGLEGAPAGFGAETQVGGTVNRVATIAALNVTLALLGAVVLQVKALLQGKDPFDMTMPRFWMRAQSQGGGMGYFGDLIFKDPTEQSGGSVEQMVGAVAGPAAGAVAGLVGDLGVVNAWEAAKGKQTHAAAEALRWVNSQLPGSSLWWTRPAYEHWILFSAQEALNPGYLGRVQQKAARDWNATWWWSPGDATPQRAPDLSTAAGR